MATHPEALGTDHPDDLTAFRRRLDELQNLVGDEALDPEVFLQELESAHEELRVAEEELRAQQEEIERLVSGQHAQRWLRDRLVAVLPVAVLVTDRLGMIRSANGAAAALLRMRLDRLLAKPVFGFVEPTDTAQLRRCLCEAVSRAEGFRATVTVRPRGAEPMVVEISATCTGAPTTAVEEVTWVVLPAMPAPEPHGRPGTDRPLSRALGALTRLNLQKGDMADILGDVAQICEQAFSFPVAASISLGPPREPTLVATRAKLAQQVDGAQVTAYEGPCWSAWEEERTVVTEDVRTDARWPRLAERLADVPVGAVVTMPVKVGDEAVGALNLYGEDDHLATGTVVADLELLAESVAAVLHEHDAKAELRRLSGQLQEAMESRAGIEQAKGMLMAMYRCTPDQAFAMLAKMSSDRNVKLRDIAHRMVEQAAEGPTRGNPVR